ncbi:MAG: succinylglutamate desuccinylase/aspartoacylase family protein, partial [Pseudomonadota bacterium]
SILAGTGHDPPMCALIVTTDLDSPGRHFGDAMLRWSDTTSPLGYHPVPVTSLKGQPGQTLLIVGGTHGDEFEGPAALMRLVHDLDPDALAGQIIALPAFNARAVEATTRTSPLDGANLNRAFPGDPLGGPTAMLAHFLETELLPRCDAAVDLHSGGKASFFTPCALPTQTADTGLAEANMALARVFGLPTIWRLGAHNDARSVNSAADRAGVPMIAAELGGGGGVDPGITNAAERGLRNILKHVGILPGSPEAPPQQRIVEIADPRDSLYAPATGLYDRALTAGQSVQAGDPAGRFHFLMEPERAPLQLVVPHDGYVLAHTQRGYVTRGDLLALIVRDVDETQA